MSYANEIKKVNKDYTGGKPDAISSQPQVYQAFLSTGQGRGGDAWQDFKSKYLGVMTRGQACAMIGGAVPAMASQVAKKGKPQAKPQAKRNYVSNIDIAKNPTAFANMLAKAIVAELRASK